MTKELAELHKQNVGLKIALVNAQFEAAQWKARFELAILDTQVKAADAALAAAVEQKDSE